MKQLMLLVLMIAVLTFAGAAVAQVTADVLGAHNVGGHGCASCHQPHSGACGNTKLSGDTGCDDTTGTLALWGRGWIAKTYTLISGGTFTTPSTTAGFIGGTSDPLFDTASCLTCHDGSVTVAGMTGHSVEPNNDAGFPPTWFGTEVASPTFSNMHPVHTTYSCGSYNWDCTVNSTTGKIYWGNSTAQMAFINNYGRGASFYAAGVGGTTVGGSNGNGATASTTAGAYIECTSCHNQHVMGDGNAEYKYQPSTWVSTNGSCTVGSNANNPYCGSYGNNGNSTYKVTWFFVKGWYDAHSATSNSAAQFCRQCHAGESNEFNNQFGVTTQ